MQEPKNDLISRQAAIDATWRETGYTDPINVATAIRDRIEALPSAQMEVIGCKDCKHRPTRKEDRGFCLDGTSLVFPDGKCPCCCVDDEYYSWMPDDDFYCKYGEMDEK